MCGYILCAKDLKVYEKNAYPYYLTLKELDEVKAERFPNANRELERFYPEYPAHIHIDILEEYTGNGVCSKLMQALFEVLKEEERIRKKARRNRSKYVAYRGYRA